MEYAGNWLTYIRERYPIVIYLLLSSGFSFSANHLAGDKIMPLPLVLSLLGILLFFFVLRLMDEVKDYEKDKIANPNRPLPRGLITVAQAKKGILYLSIAMALYSAMLALIINYYSGMAYLILTIYLLLMYKEFYISEWLCKRVLIYAISHQLILVVLCCFAISCFSPTLALSKHGLTYALLVLFSFFSYEICRKLEPNANPVLGTYLTIFGLGKTFFLVAILSLSSITTVIVTKSPSLYILGGVTSLIIISMIALFFRSNLYKLAEAIASLSLLLHIWSGSLNYAFS